jgi:Integrase core domain/GAG-pre-integrase domain
MATIEPNVPATMANEDAYASPTEWVDSAFVAISPTDKHQWCVDSGATRHMSPHRDLFTDYTGIPPILIRVANGATLPAVGRGRVDISLLLEGIPTPGYLQDVLHVPGLSRNLFSVPATTAKGHIIHMETGNTTIWTKEGILIASATDYKGLFRLNVEHQEEANLVDAQLWHERLGHINIKRIEQMANGLVEGMDTISHSHPHECEACSKGKDKQKSISTAPTERATSPLERVHSDICGPMPTTSIGGAKYFATFIDDCTRYTWVYFLKKKSDLVKAFIEWEKFVTTQTQHKLLTLRSDNGGEYIGHPMQKELRERGIKHERTAPNTPGHNGVAERKNFTLVSSSRAMIFHAGLPPSFWAEAMRTANIISNSAPTKAVTGMTPHEAWHGKKPNLEYIRVFGCRAFALNQGTHVTKFQSRVNETIYLGPSEFSSGFRLWHTATRKPITSRNVRFFETKDSPIISLTNTSDFIAPQLSPSYVDIDIIIPSSETPLALPAPTLIPQVAPPANVKAQPTVGKTVAIPRISLPNTVVSIAPFVVPPHLSTNRNPTANAKDKVATSRNVSFASSPGGDKTKTKIHGLSGTSHLPAPKGQTPSEKSSTSGASAILNSPIISLMDTVEFSAPLPIAPSYAGTDTTRSGRVTKVPPKYSSTEFAMLADGNEPSTYEEAIRGPHAPQWTSAMENEIKSLSDNQT